MEMKPALVGALLCLLGTGCTSYQLAKNVREWLSS